MADDRRKRVLSDEDARAVAKELETLLTSRFYSNIGKGVFNLAWKGACLAGLALAAYGAAHGYFK